MQNLNPTLWRTCRMLSGRTRIRLLRALHDHPGRNVTEYARELDIGCSDASQELRRIQSRGLLQTVHRGASVIYRFGPDPQVGSAHPLLKALESTLSSDSPEEDSTIAIIAAGLAHPKRIAIFKSLKQSPKSAFALQKEIRTSYGNLQRHLCTLIDSGLVTRQDRMLRHAVPAHRLAKALVKLLPD